MRSGFIRTNQEALLPDCPSLENSGQGVRNGYIASKRMVRDAPLRQSTAHGFD
jgi:hypothetical protein